MKLKQHIIAAATVMLAVSCSAQDYPILNPTDTGPCGVGSTTCRSGGCCWAGYECTDSNIQSMYSYPGYCRWVGN